MKSSLSVPVRIILLPFLLGLTGCHVGPKSDAYQWYIGGGVYQGGSPSITSDGNELVYSSPRSGHGDLYLWNNKTKTTLRLTHNPEYEGSPSISADGRYIVFVKRVGDIEPLWLMDTHLKTSREIVSSVSCSQPVISPDGQYIAYLQPELFVLNVHTQKRHRVPGIHSAMEPTWGAMGHTIYYRSGDVNHPEIRKVSIDGKDDSFVCSGFSPAISHDNKKIAFLSGAYSNEVWIMDLHSSTPKLLDSSNSAKESLRFHPDNSHLIFLDDVSHEGNYITLMDTTTDSKKIIAKL